MRVGQKTNKYNLVEELDRTYLRFCHNFTAAFSLVRFSWFVVKLVRFAEYKLVLSSSEGVFENGNWVKIDIAVGAGRLPSTGTIKVPNW